VAGLCPGGNGGASAPEQRSLLSVHRRIPQRKPPKLTLIAAGSVLALAGAAAGAVVAWPSGTPAASASVAGASFTGSAAQLHSLTGAAARDSGLTQSAQDLKAREASARLTATRREIAHQRAVARARKARLAAARKAATARRAAQSTATTASQPAPAAQPQGDPQQVAQGMLGSFGWSSSQFSCLQPLWNAESGWSVSASNPSSGAYGIPQALPGSKMASAGPDWQTSAATQIRWGLGYIKSTYGSPCAAWSHEQTYGWY
jgi:hypothetical protein